LYVIESFGDAATEDLYHGRFTARARRFPADLVRIARRKLDLINAAHVLDDLKVPPGNRLEGLAGKAKGLHSIRINDQCMLAPIFPGHSFGVMCPREEVSGKAEV
jgi:toxin HigB-1